MKELSFEERKELPRIYEEVASTAGFKIKLPKEFERYCAGKENRYNPHFIKFSHPLIPFDNSVLGMFFLSEGKGFSIGGGYSLGIESKRSGSLKRYPNLNYSLNNLKRIESQGRKILNLINCLEKKREMDSRGQRITHKWSRVREDTGSHEVLDYEWIVKARNEADVEGLEVFLRTVNQCEYRCLSQ